MGEILIIFLVALMLFGSKKIPDLARSLGKGLNELRKASEDIKREFMESTEEIREDLSEFEKDLHQNNLEIKNIVDDFNHNINTTNSGENISGAHDTDTFKSSEADKLPDKKTSAKDNSNQLESSNNSTEDQVPDS